MKKLKKFVIASLIVIIVGIVSFTAIPSQTEIEPEPELVIEIGGEVYRVKNYGELLTSVINPNHEISPESVNKLVTAGRSEKSTPMPFYGDAMTITEMINLVAFLRAQYSKIMPDFFQSYVPGDSESS